MGSRAVAVVCPRRGGRRARGSASTAGRPASCYTRTGRPFFDAPSSTRAGRPAARRRAAPLFDALDDRLAGCSTASCCPGRRRRCGLIREQYAVGRRCRRRRAARGRSPLLAARGPRARRRPTCWPGSSARAEDAAAFTRRLRGATAGRPTGSTASRLAPFQLLACEGRTPALERATPWHLALLGSARRRAAHAHPAPRRRPRRSGVGAERPSTGGCELTASGGEGMVVKPLAA